MANRLELFVIQTERFKEGHPNVIFVMIPELFSADFDILLKKLEASELNNLKYLPKWGQITRILHIKRSEGIELYSDDIQPISFADWANILLNQLNQHMDEDDGELSNKIEEELIFFIGELTMLRDGSI